MWVVNNDFRPKSMMWKERKMQWLYSGEREILPQAVIKVTINSDVIIKGILDMFCWECHLICMVFLPQTHNPSLVMRKTSDKFQLRDISTKYLTSTLQNCQSHHKKGKSEKFTAKRQTWGKVVIKFNVLPGWASRTEKRALDKTKEAWGLPRWC